MEASVQSSSPASWRATCVILTDAPAASPGSRDRPAGVDMLMRLLERRGLEVRPAVGVYAAFADVLLHQRERMRGGLNEPLVLVLVEPESMRGAASLHEAMLRHAPRVVMWEYHGEPTPTLRAFHGVREPERRHMPARKRQPADPPAEERRLRLAGSPPAPSANEPTPTDPGEVSRPASGPAMLSDEELAMLLGDSDDRDQSREGRGR